MSLEEHAVTADKIAANAITADMIRANAVTIRSVTSGNSATLEPVKPPQDAEGRERRFVTVSDLEFREDETGKSQFVGHAAVFNRKANIGGMFLEEIAPGAFRKAVQESDVRMLFNHDPNLVLARNRAGTLRLSEDDIGLLSEADLDRRQSYANDLAISLERGDVTEMSFAFRAIKDTWEERDDDIPLRTIQEAQLFDVSPVTYPAYTETDAALRSAGFDALFSELPEEERTNLLKAITSGQVDPDAVPALEAAGEALRELARSFEPPVRHSQEQARCRHNFLARKHDQPLDKKGT